jgi:hypothetical protein
MTKIEAFRGIMKAHLNGATFISLNTLTEETLAGGRKNPFQGRVTKRTIGSNVMLFANKYVNGYEAMVKRRLEQEGKDCSSFELSPRTWGTRLANEPFIEHKGQHYLEVIFKKAGVSTYYVDGQEFPAALIHGLKVNAPEGAQGGLENKVIIRTYHLNSIESITIAGDTYSLV